MWSDFGLRLLYTGLVAFTEEALFRGYMFARLQEAFGEKRLLRRLPIDSVLLITSASFGLWHVIHGVLGGIEISGALL